MGNGIRRIRPAVVAAAMLAMFVCGNAAYACDDASPDAAADAAAPPLSISGNCSGTFEDIGPNGDNPAESLHE